MTETTQTTPERSVSHGSFTIERTYPYPPERVFRAFSDRVAKRRWFAEGTGFSIDEYTLDFQVGGREFCRFRFGDGPPMTFDSIFMDIVPDERIVNGYSMTMAGIPFSGSLSTTEFEATSEGTRMVYTEQCAFLDGKDGIEDRKEGSIQLLERLAGELEASR